MLTRTVLMWSLPVLAGCATVPPAHERSAFIQYRAGQSAPYQLDAPYGGTLTQRGPCLGIVREGRFSTLIWPETARIGFDRQGLVVSDARDGTKVRLGEYVQFTGGPLLQGMTHPLGGETLCTDMPIVCAQYPGYDGWIAIVNSGFSINGDTPPAAPSEAKQ